MALGPHRLFGAGLHDDQAAASIVAHVDHVLRAHVRKPRRAAGRGALEISDLYSRGHAAQPFERRDGCLVFVFLGARSLLGVPNRDRALPQIDQLQHRSGRAHSYPRRPHQVGVRVDGRHALHLPVWSRARGKQLVRDLAGQPRHLPSPSSFSCFSRRCGAPKTPPRSRRCSSRRASPAPASHFT